MKGPTRNQEATNRANRSVSLKKQQFVNSLGGGAGRCKAPLQQPEGGGQGVDQKCGFHTSQGSRGPHGLEAQGPGKDDKGLRITTQVVPIKSQLHPQVGIALDEGPRFSEDVHIALLKGA